MQPRANDVKHQHPEQNIERLNSCGALLKNETWQDYKTTDLESEASQVHLTITEPPLCGSRSFIHEIRTGSDVSSEIDENEISEFCLFCKTSLVSGGYVVIVLPFYSYTEWHKHFHVTVFDIMRYRYVFMFDSNTIQYRNHLSFPQNVALFGMLCKLHGTSKHGSFNTTFHWGHCTNRRNLAECLVSNIQNDHAVGMVPAHLTLEMNLRWTCSVSLWIFSPFTEIGRWTLNVRI